MYHQRQPSSPYFGPRKRNSDGEGRFKRKSFIITKATTATAKTKLSLMHHVVGNRDNHDKMVHGRKFNTYIVKDQQSGVIMQRPKTNVGFAFDPVAKNDRQSNRAPTSTSNYGEQPTVSRLVPCAISTQMHEPKSQLERHTPMRSVDASTKECSQHPQLEPKKGFHFKAMPGLVYARKNGDTLNQYIDPKGRSSKDSIASIKRSMSDGFHLKGEGHRLGDISNKVSYYSPLTKEVKDNNPLAKEVNDNNPLAKEVKDNMTMRKRKYTENADEENDCGDKNSTTIGLTSHTAILKDHHVTTSASDSVKRRRYSCSQPIDEPIWSGIFKIGANDYIPLAAHLSTKSCDKVWKISRSLDSVVEVTKLSRLEVWPKSFEKSSSAYDNIGVYFFPPNMSPNDDLDQLTKEVVENDMALRSFVGEAEMLIFPSTLLPEQHQTFQKKHYLWGMFKRRAEHKVASPAKQQDASGSCYQAKEATTNEHHASNLKPHDGPQRKQPVKPPMAPSEKKMSQPAHGGAEETTRRDGGEAGATVEPQGKLFGFVVRQTPRIEKLIQEMEREGAVMVAVQGEMMMGSSGIGQAMPSRLWEQQRCPETIYF